MIENLNNAMQEIYDNSLNKDEELIKEIIKIESTAKQRETNTRTRKEKIRNLLLERLDGMAER